MPNKFSKMVFILTSIFMLFVGPKGWAALTSSSPCENVSQISVVDFGANGTSLTFDNFNAFQNALNYASRCLINTVNVPAGTYYFVPPPPTDVGSRGIFISSNTSLMGVPDSNGHLPILKVAPSTTTYASFFRSLNAENVVFNKLAFEGNGVTLKKSDGTLNANGGGAILFYYDSTLTQPLTSRNLVQSSTFTNFTGHAWVEAENTSNQLVQNILIVANTFTSMPGNIGDPDHHQFLTKAIDIQGSELYATGVIDTVTIENNIIDATHIRGGIAIWSGVTNATIQNNQISNAGADANNEYVVNSSGQKEYIGYYAYAINVYDNSYEVKNGKGIAPNNIKILNNNIVSPRSCGVYTASANTIYIIDNTISGATDTYNDTLPRGAIALNSPRSATVTGNTISGSYIGIESVSTIYGGHIQINQNTITNILTNGFGLYFDLVPVYNVNAAYDLKIDGAAPNGTQHTDTTSIYVRALGGYGKLENIVEMHTQSEMRAMNSSGQDLTSVSAIQATSPWGAVIQGIWQCSSYPYSASQIEQYPPGSYGCTNQASF